MRNFLILLCLAIITLGLPSITLSASSADLWARQFLIPDARILWSQETVFSECLFVGNDNQWHYCADKKRPLCQDYVAKKVDVDDQFNVPVAGKLYSILEANIDKDAWLYKHVKLFLYKYDKKQGKWIGVNIKTYSALFRGQDLIYDRPEAKKFSMAKHLSHTSATMTAA